MGKDQSIIILPPASDVPTPDEMEASLGADLLLLMSDQYQEELGEMDVLYQHVSNPKVHIKDKINSLLRIHMFYSKSMLAGNVNVNTVLVYRARKEALNDLQRMIETLNNYTSVDNFDIEHPMYSKSLSMIIELILTCVKSNLEAPQFDAVVRDVAVSMPGVEARIKRLIEESTTEEILAMQSNPLMDAYKESRGDYESYLFHYDDFMEYMKIKGSR